MWYIITRNTNIKSISNLYLAYVSISIKGKYFFNFIIIVAAHAYYTGATGQFDTNIAPEQWRRWALSGGDDYELLFTAPVAQRSAVAAAAQGSQTAVTRIGQIDAACGLRLVDAQGQPVPNTYASFDHFA